MKAKIKIKNKETTVRERPTDASSLLKTVDISEDIYLVTNYIKGWYFIDEFYGWVKVSDVIVTEKIEDFEDEDMSNGSSSETETGKTPLYDGKAIIQAINEDTENCINAGKIYFMVDDKQINLQTLLKSLNNALNDMQSAVNKMANMPEIPALKNNADEGNVLSVDKDDSDALKCVWKNANYKKLDNVPLDVLNSEW